MADATLNTPISRSSETKYVVRSFQGTPLFWGIECSIQDAGSTETRVVAFSIDPVGHPAATVVAFLTAIGTTRVNESGTVLNRANFRLLGFLLDTGYLTSVTLNP